MNFEVMALMMRKAFGSPTKKQVIQMMAADADDDDWFFRSAEWLGAVCEVHERTIRRAWADLEQAGVIERIGVKKRRGGDVIIWRLDLKAVRKLPDVFVDGEAGR